MADLTITIPLPVLAAGQYFKERHRLLPGGAWNSYTNRGNAPFTITGVSEGEYEFEFILVKADGTHCPPVYRTYYVQGEYDCISFATTTTRTVAPNGTYLYYVDITYVLPPGHTDPQCGWEIEYRRLDNTVQKVHYNALPTSGQIKMLTQNTGGVIYIYANQCNGQLKQCHAYDLGKIPDAPCEAMTVHPVATILYQNGTWYLSIGITQSMPPSSSVFVAYHQYNLGTFFTGQRFSTTVWLSPGSTVITLPLAQPPVIPTWATKLYFTGFVVDACGNGMPFTAEYII